MRARARSVAAQGLGMGFFPPGGHFQHQPRQEEGLAGPRAAGGAAEILVHPAEIVFAGRGHKARAKGPDGAGGIDAPVARVHRHGAKPHARRAEIRVAPWLGW